jgi:hypothetical protein
MGTEVVQHSGASEQLTRNVPSALQAAGVQVVEEAGRRGVIIPPALRKQANVLEPITEVAAADPNWTPSVRLAELDPEMHAYNQQGKKALNKQGLEVLAELAGVIRIDTQRMARSELADTEKFGWKATVHIRRSDGTVKPISASKTWDQEVEYEELRDAATTKGEADLKKKWLNERKHASRKTESKAILAAIRGALHVPHGFTPAQFQKPFVVIGYAFTPNYDDPATREILIRHGLGAGSEMFGGAAAGVERQLAELPPADIEPHAEIVPVSPDQPPPPLIVDPTPSQTDTEPVGDPEPTGDPVGPEPDPNPEVPEPDQAPFSEADQQPQQGGDPEADALYERALNVVWPSGRHKGHTYRQILLGDAEAGVKAEPTYLGWISTANVQPGPKKAAEIICARHPETQKQAS